MLMNSAICNAGWGSGVSGEGGEPEGRMHTISISQKCSDFGYYAYGNKLDYELKNPS